MAAEVLEFEEIVWERREEESVAAMMFADVTSAARKAVSPSTSDTGASSDVIPESFPDLAMEVSGITASEMPAGDAEENEGALYDGGAELSADADHRAEQTDPVRLEQRAWQEGWEAGLARGREEHADTIRAERERFASQVQALSRAFDEIRDDYLHRLERESVRLSLVCASRILRREVHADPLALTGALRAALGQLAASAEVRIIVPAQDEPMWRESMALIPGLAHRPQIVGEEAMKAGECQVESELGRADLSIAAQLTVLEEAMLQTPHAVSDGEGAACGEKASMGNHTAESGTSREARSEGVALK
jgi:flagellar assembly protein FliH